MKKGTAIYFVIWSILGILVGLFLIFHGNGGNGLSPTLTLLVGIFFVIKEIVDMFH